MDKAKIKETVLTISTGFLVLYLILKVFRSQDVEWLLYLALGVSITGLISDKAAYGIHSGWFWIADKIGWLMSKVFLSLIFFLVLLPVGTLAKLFRKDFMFLNKRPDSYYTVRSKKYRAEDFEDPW